MLQRLAPLGLAIVQMGNANLPSQETEQRNKRDQLREPESSARKKRSKRLRFRRQFCQLMQNFLLRGGAWPRRGSRCRQLRRGGRGILARGGAAFHADWNRIAS